MQLFRKNENVVKFVIANQAIDVTVKSLTSNIVSLENRFGVSLSHGKQFVVALKNLKIKGYKVFRNYSIPAKSASVNAETFLWNVMEYKVSRICSNKN